MRHLLVRIYLIGLIVLFTLSLPLWSEADTRFPNHSVIAPNVAFWTKVYTEYTTTQAIVHDSKNLNIIYDIIDLKPYEDSSARKINRRRMKTIKTKYQNILKRLAADPGTRNVECRRIAELFDNPRTAKTFRAASVQVRCQIGQSDRFRAGLIRSGAYINEIRAIFKSYDLPEELAYLPHVESSFNIGAYSKFGAAGIWQFTRSTGKRFMKVNYVLDERRDPILATHAAANLLKENYEKLGSWPLAITAYNHGAAGMERARKSLGSYPAIFSGYRSRTFKFASRNFYSEFLAAYQVAANYQAYFGELPLDSPDRCQTIPLDGYAGFKQLCDHFNVSPTVAQTLNPALRPPVIEGQKLVPKGYPFHIPNSLTLAAAIPQDMYKADQKPSHFYTVQRGDTAGKIARIHSVKLTDLILANNLDRRARIYPRQTLRIPLPGRPLPANPDPLPEPPDPALTAQNETGKSIETQIPENEPIYPRPILAALIPTAITGRLAGDDIKDESPPSAEIVSADVRFENIIRSSSLPTGLIQVEVEETLGHYAEWARVRTQQIRRLNKLPFGRALHLHQKIKIPLKNVSPNEFEEHRYEFHKRLQEDFFAVYRISELHSYQVNSGDNLWNLSLEKFGIPMWLLKNCNPEVDFAELRMQQKLMVPTIEKNPGQDPDPAVESEDDAISDNPADLSMRQPIEKIKVQWAFVLRLKTPPRIDINPYG